MFKTGEIVCYGRVGVCRVTAVEEKSLPPKGERRRCYVLKPLYQDCTITTPVEGGKISIRPVMSAAEANALIDSIPERNDEAFFSRNLGRLKDHYRQIVDRQDSAQLLGLTISLFRKREEAKSSGRKFGVVDERFMKEAEQLLFGELSVALDIPYDEVINYIATRLAVRES